MNLANLIIEKESLLQQIQEEQERHTVELHELNKKLLKCTEALISSSKGLDHNKISLAESVIFASGDFGYGDDPKIVSKAINDIANGCPTLRTEYFGTKNYDKWHHQESSHPYGYGPRHGNIVFQIGKIHPSKPLSEEEQEAAIYYLLNLKAIKESELEAQDK